MLTCALGLKFRFDLHLWLLLFPAVMAGAWLYGRREERAVAAALAVDLVVSHFVDFHDPAASRLGALATDSIFLLALGVIALLGRRWWPCWSAAFQLMIVIIHALFAAGREIDSRAYMIALVIWTWLVMLALASGVWDRVADARRASTLVRSGAAMGTGAAIFIAAFGFCLWQLADLGALDRLLPS